MNEIDENPLNPVNQEFTPDEPDNNSFSNNIEDEKISYSNTASYYQAPLKRKMPVWPFILVAIFFIIGLLLFFSIGKQILFNKFPTLLNDKECVENPSKKIPKKISIDKRIVIIKNNSKTIISEKQALCEEKETQKQIVTAPAPKVQVSPREQSTNKITNSRAKATINKPINSVGGVYVVQVFSTVNKDEADAKYDEIKAKGAEKVWITTTINSGIIWYRVRLGEFTSNALAEQKAKSLGISNYWIIKQ